MRCMQVPATTAHALIDALAPPRLRRRAAERRQTGSRPLNLHVRGHHARGRAGMLRLHDVLREWWRMDGDDAGGLEKQRVVQRDVAELTRWRG